MGRFPYFWSFARVTLAVVILLVLSTGPVRATTDEDSKPSNSTSDSPSSPSSPPAPPVPGAASFSVASYLNQGLPSWFKIGGVYRFRAEGHTSYGYREGVDDAFALSRLRLNFTIQPTSWLNLFVEGQDARVGGVDPSRLTTTMKDTADLRQLWVRFGNPESSLVTLKAGRQELAFGEERLVGAANWGNSARVFDAVRMTVGTPAAHVDLFASSVVVNQYTSFDDHQAGNNLHGAYGSLSKILPQATIEPFVFWKTAQGAKDESKHYGKQSSFTGGVRINGKIGKRFDYTTEMARQGGNIVNDEIDAWAGMWRAGYKPPFLPKNIRLYAEYDYASGNGQKGFGRNSTFDQLYPTNHSFYGNADAVGWRNMRDASVGSEFRFGTRWKVNAEQHNFSLASPFDGLYQDNGSLSVAAPASGALHTDVGREADFFASYKLNSQTTVGAGWGHLFLGRFLKENTQGAPTSYPYFQMSYTF